MNHHGEKNMIETKIENTPAILDIDQALDDFRQKMETLIDPASEDEWDGVKLKEREGKILLAGLVLVGHCIAILISQLVLIESVKQAAKIRVKGVAGLNYTNDSLRWVTITLIGGVQVRVRTLYRLARKPRKGRGRKRKRGKRGKSQGQGYYPVLQLLGISEGVSPLVRSLVAQAATQMISLKQAQSVLVWVGLTFSTRRIRRISLAFCQIGLQVRANKLAHPSPPGTTLKGKRVVVTVDGGRIRIREPKRRGRKRKSGRRGYKGDWKEPKLLSIYVLDEDGRKLSGVDIPLVSDGTLMGKKAFLEILEMYLRELGISLAETVVLIGDGAKWIWKRIPVLLERLGCHSEQIIQILDYYHAKQHLYQLADALFGNTPQSKAWAQKWSRKLKQGCIQALMVELDRFLTQEIAKDPKEFLTQYNYFQGHHEHGRLAYRRFRTLKLPIGSGVVESLIRQVVNLRLKSAGKFWLLETAEAFLHARCQWAAQHWINFCNDVLTFGLAHPSTI